MEGPQEAGLDLIRWLQAASPALDGPMRAFTTLGAADLFLVLLPLLYWLVQPSLAFRLLVVLLVADLATTSLKLLLQQPRPTWLGGVKPLEHLTSFGLPSGHASTAVAGWGALAIWARRRWVSVGAVIVIGLVGLSRVYLGAHFPHDVVAGWLVGWAVLLLLPVVERPALPWLQARRRGTVIGLAVVVSLAVVGLGMLVGLTVDGGPARPGWPAVGDEGQALIPYVNDAGVFLGAVVGLVGFRQRAPAARGGTWLRQLARVLVGLIGLLLVWRGLAVGFSLLAPETSPLGLGLRYLRYAAVGLWVAGLAPWLFLTVGGPRPAPMDRHR